ncbi:MAG: hypothetical protein Q4E67_00290 [Planctomycetia bacterium]|nr:hypothetical protein [Planctomycetia bacterium]
MRMRRWKENGTLQAIFNLLQKKFKLDVNMSVLLQEMTRGKEPSNKTEVRKKTAAKSPAKRVTKKTLKST